MKVPHGEGVATRTGPESCVVAGDRDREALTGESAGRVFSREITIPAKAGTPGCRRCKEKRKATPGAPIGRGAPGPRAVKDPVHARKHLAREPGDPPIVCGAWVTGRAGNPEGIRR